MSGFFILQVFPVCIFFIRRLTYTASFSLFYCKACMSTKTVQHTHIDATKKTWGVYSPTYTSQQKGMEDAVVPLDNTFKEKYNRSGYIQPQSQLRYRDLMRKKLRVIEHGIESFFILAKKKISQSPIGMAICKFLHICDDIDKK